MVKVAVPGAITAIIWVCHPYNPFLLKLRPLGSQGARQLCPVGRWYPRPPDWLSSWAAWGLPVNLNYALKKP